MKRAGKPRWLDVRHAYVSSDKSLRDLAQEFGISLHTLEKRCKREGWFQERARLGSIVTASAENSAAEQGKALGMTAAAFVERSIAETCEWMDRIEILATKGELNTDELAKLVSAWRTTIGAGREAFRLDAGPAPTLHFTAAILSEPEPPDPALKVPSGCRLIEISQSKTE